MQSMAERSALEERALRDALRNAAMIELYAGRARVRAGVRVFMDDAQRRGLVASFAGLTASPRSVGCSSVRDPSPTHPPSPGVKCAL